jgi:hypothetical protein
LRDESLGAREKREKGNPIRNSAEIWRDDFVANGALFATSPTTNAIYLLFFRVHFPRIAELFSFGRASAAPSARSPRFPLSPSPRRSHLKMASDGEAQLESFLGISPRRFLGDGAPRSARGKA